MESHQPLGPGPVPNVLVEVPMMENQPQNTDRETQTGLMTLEDGVMLQDGDEEEKWNAQIHAE